MPPSVKLSTPAGYSYLVADYVALNETPVERFMESAKKQLAADELQAINRYTYITYVGLKVLAKAMEGCGKDLTRACTIEQLRKIKNFDTGGLTGPLSFDNPKQLTGTSVKVYQLNLKDSSFTSLTGFADY